MEPSKLREGLRREGLYVAEGDPVLELAAICEVALADTVKTIERVTKQQADRITITSTQTLADAKKQAEALVTGAGAWGEKRIKEAAEAAGAMVLARLREETARAEQASHIAVRIAWVTGVSCLLLLALLGGMALAALGVGHP